jgi:hypothetical protein
MCSSGGQSSQTVQATQFDPLYPGSGGSDVRSDVYSTRAGLSPTWNSRAATSAADLTSRSTDPTWQNGFQLNSDQVSGNYLGGSPQLTDQINTMRQQQMRESGDAQNAIRTKYARTGNSLSTGVDQNLINANAAATARGDANQSAIIGNNYAQERKIQQNSVSGAEYAANVPTNFRTQATNVQFDPLAKSTQLATGLSGGTTVAAPDVIARPGVLDYAIGALAAA